MSTQTIHCTVNPRLLGKAGRLFTGTLEGRIIEVLQNARRASLSCPWSSYLSAAIWRLMLFA